MRTPVVRRAAVLGAGVMGAQIAAHLVHAGIEVTLFDLASEEGNPSHLSEQAIGALKKLKPSPLADKAVLQHIKPANYKMHLPALADCDWVIEAISERIDWKSALYAQIAPHISDKAWFTTNTSGLSIAQLAEKLPESLQSRFLGVHFFNPPRYMHLVELIPHDKTDGDCLDALETFLTATLGKGVVRAKDTPNFVGNRIGVFSILSLLHHAEAFHIAPEVVDQLTGPLLGRPKSATYRTMDVVGLDTMMHVVKTMQTGLPQDPWVGYFKMPEWITALVGRGALGQKTKRGVFQKAGGQIQVYDVDDETYRPANRKADPQILALFQKDWPSCVAALATHDHPQAQFLWAVLRDLWHYSAVVLADIADNARDVDMAMRWGFGWETGPFELWQAAGWSTVCQHLSEAIAANQTLTATPLPDWVQAIEGAYEGEKSYAPVQARYVAPLDLPVYQKLTPIKSVAGVLPTRGQTVFENEGLRLWSDGDACLIASFRAHRNCISQQTLLSLMEAIDIAEAQQRPLVLWPDKDKDFSVGANLKQALAILDGPGGIQDVAAFVALFQDVSMRLSRAAVPVVVGVRGMVLGGGCELMMHAHHTVAAFESYIGLVETGVGLIPAAGGSKVLAARIAQQAQVGLQQHWLEKYFTQVGYAKVSTSAPDAIALGYLRPTDTIVMHTDEVLSAAKAMAIGLSAAWRPRSLNQHIVVAGRAGFAYIEAMLTNMSEGHYLSDHDRRVLGHAGRVLCGGDVDAGTTVDEKWLLRLEREAFVDLAQTVETRARLEHTLKTGKPLRN